jgi:hypothetical protein
MATTNTAASHAETTYAITVDPNDEAAERWFAQADEAGPSPGRAWRKAAA